MYKHILCTLAILAIFMTIQSDTRSDNDVYNEDKPVEIRYYNYDDGIFDMWKIKQRGADSEDNGGLQTYVGIKAADTKVSHALLAYAGFYSRYAYPRIQGSWYLRAQLHHDWGNPTKNPMRIEVESEVYKVAWVNMVNKAISITGQNMIQWTPRKIVMHLQRQQSIIPAKVKAIDRFLIHTSHLSRSSGNTKNAHKVIRH